MKLAHLADLHLGFRQYERTTAAGVNVREEDVARAFTQMVTAIIERKPDIVVVAGDVFHSSKPSNRAVMLAFTQFARLTAAGCEVVVVAGNHDWPKSINDDCILPLLRDAGVTVVDAKAERMALFVNGKLLELLAVPDTGAPRPQLKPELNCEYRVLLIHGEVAGVIPAHSLERASLEIPVADLNGDEWNYIALGHYHDYHEVGRNAFYAGSIEYTATNFWAELEDGRSSGKGFVVRDLDSGAHEFVRIKPQREIIDIPEFSVHGLTAAEVDERIRDITDSLDVDGKIIRMRMTNVPRGLMKEVDQKQIRSLKRRALHFHLVPVKVETALTAAGMPAMIRGRRESLPAYLETYFRDRPDSPDVSKDNLVALGQKYLAEAGEEIAVDIKEAAAA